jgi:hypothetical protein
MASIPNTESYHSLDPNKSIKYEHKGTQHH